MHRIMLSRYAFAFSLLFLIGGLAMPVIAQPASLKTVELPSFGRTETFIKNRDAAIRLGKALFWDEQAGGDGRVACATCHFSAGVDARSINTIHPGPNGVLDSGIPFGVPLTAADFPIAGDDSVGSQGVVSTQYLGDNPTDPNAVDLHILIDDGVFFPARQVTPRQAGSFIMSVFNRQSGWDGAADRRFTGAYPGGPQDPVIFFRHWDMDLDTIAMQRASAATQALRHANNSVEMSGSGRLIADLGRKMLGRKPLALQQVSPDDSVLGDIADPAGGLTVSYEELIRAAFKQRWYNSVFLTPDGYTQLEANFGMYWSMSILYYNSRLLPNDTPFDQFQEGETTALTDSQIRGMDVFFAVGCADCHGGSTFTGAALEGGEGSVYSNTGVTPTAGDLGRNNGRFKVPSLRNVELTGPYFHNGRYLTLRQVVDFYDRGGDFDNPEKDPRIVPLGMSEQQKVDLVNFLISLTDNRVRRSKRPFDHPSLNPPNGDPLPAIGTSGGPPMLPFLNANHHDG